MSKNSPRKSSRPIATLAAVLLALGLVAGCQTDLDIEGYEYLCASHSECSGGYRCAHLQDRGQAICVPPDQVEVCATVGDEDDDGVADCDDQECAQFAGCSTDPDAGADTDGGEEPDAGDDTGADADAGGDVDAGAPDEDGDGVIDDLDNCPRHYNPEQRESAVQGIGLACADGVAADEADLILYEDSEIGAGTWSGGVAVLGSWNDDERDDIAIGTPSADGGRGAVSILYSGTAPTSGTSELGAIDISRLEAPNSDGWYGAGVAAIGDVTNNGLSELVVGHPGFSSSTNHRSGAIHIYEGGNPHATFMTLAGAQTGDAAGNAVVALGDVDGDGVPDFAVGAPDARRGGTGGVEGIVYIISGAALSNMTELEDSAATILGPFDSGFGEIIAAGDFDNDGLGDLALGAPREGTGLVFVIYGSTLKESPGGVFDLSNSSGYDLKISTADSSGDFGASVALGGSLDGDDVDDLVIGLPYAHVDSAGAITGKLFVISGRDGTAPVGQVVVETSADIILHGVQSGQLLGFGLTYVGDINGDGRDDLVATAKDSGDDSQGAAYLLVGPYSDSPVAVTDVSMAFEGENPHDNLGLLAAPAGSYAGGEFPGFFLYSPSGDIDEFLIDVPTWYFFSGPFYAP